MKTLLEQNMENKKRPSTWVVGVYPPSKSIQNIDWELLREQKADLVYMSQFIEVEKLIGSIEGVIALLDALQDYAADDMGLGDKVVFNLDEDGSEIN